MILPFLALIPIISASCGTFSRPVLSRTYEQNSFVLQGRETPETIGAGLAGLSPSYVSGLIYIQQGTTIEPDMVSAWKTIRSAILECNPSAKFDVEISLNPTPVNHGIPFANGEAVRAKMEYVNQVLGSDAPDGFWFDFWSTAYVEQPEWVSNATEYAHSTGQTVGGNVFGTRIPPGSDAVAFVDKGVNGSYYGFDFNVTQIGLLREAANGTNTTLIGHLQSNAQNANQPGGTFSCYWNQAWNNTRRIDYLEHWAAAQSGLDFTFMYPGYYPLCPATFAFDMNTTNPVQQGSYYANLIGLMDEYSCC